MKLLIERPWPVALCAVFCLLLALAPAPTDAQSPPETTTLEIPLPGLLGAYPYDRDNYERSVTFVYDGVDARVHSGSIHLVGEVVDVGLLNCCLSSPCEYMPVWPLQTYASLRRAETSGYWHSGEMYAEKGAFDTTSGLARVRSGFETIAHGDELTVHLLVGPTAFIAICAPASDPPSGAIAEAVLVLEIEPSGSPSPVEAASWGRMKAIYE
ncbi:MAG: hypothetical protein OEO21_06995 [Candidatus Krumholzibacteria bacterium]|nr:hypothetical protein [Candidatus Krumholzibacteria bacterium]